MPLIQRIAMPVIDKRTTRVCLHVAGQIVDTDEEFETLAGDFMDPPFHIHCRTMVAPWMPGMVNQVRKDSNAELQRRPKKFRRIGPDGEIGARIPPPSTGNNPSGFSFPGAVRSKYQQDGVASDKGWAPVMGRADAEEFARGSVVDVDVYHGTPSRAAAESIREEGFDVDLSGSRSGDRGFSGKGIYFSTDAGYAGQYASALTDNPGEVLRAKVALFNPWIDNPAAGETSLEKFIDAWVEDNPGLSRKERVDRLADAIRAEAERRGHDGVISYFKGVIHEIVVFAKESVVILRGE